MVTKNGKQGLIKYILFSHLLQKLQLHFKTCLPMILFLYHSSQYNTKVERHGVGQPLAVVLGALPNPPTSASLSSCHYVAQASLELFI